MWGMILQTAAPPPPRGPATKMVHPEPCKELRRRISATIYGWDRPLLPFIYPFFCLSVFLLFVGAHVAQVKNEACDRASSSFTASKQGGEGEGAQENPY